MKVEQAKCSETLAHKIQTPGNYPKERIKIILDWGFVKHLNALLLENEGILRVQLVDACSQQSVFNG
jgi:hypothetical protein